MVFYVTWGNYANAYSLLIGSKQRRDIFPFCVIISNILHEPWALPATHLFSPMERSSIVLINETINWVIFQQYSQWHLASNLYNKKTTQQSRQVIIHLRRVNSKWNSLEIDPKLRSLINQFKQITLIPKDDNLDFLFPIIVWKYFRQYETSDRWNNSIARFSDWDQRTTNLPPYPLYRDTFHSATWHSHASEMTISLIQKKDTSRFLSFWSGVACRL